MGFNEAKIRRTLDKYWEGRTTLEEEKNLKSYFSQGEVAEDLRPFQSIFQTLNKEATLTLDDPNFESKFWEEVGETPGGKVVSLKPKNQWLKRIASAAAVLAIGFMTYTVMTDSLSAPEQLSEAERQEALKAYEETKAALLLVSSKLNQGAKKTAEELKNLKQIEKVIKLD